MGLHGIAYHSRQSLRHSLLWEGREVPALHEVAPELNRVDVFHLFVFVSCRYERTYTYRGRVHSRYVKDFTSTQTGLSIAIQRYIQRPVNTRSDGGAIFCHLDPSRRTCAALGRPHRTDKVQFQIPPPKLINEYLVFCWRFSIFHFSFRGERGLRDGSKRPQRTRSKALAR